MASKRDLSYTSFLSLFLLGIIIGLERTESSIQHSPTGACQHYYGKCSEHLNSTEHRYVNTTFGLNETEKIADELLKEAEKYFMGERKNHECKEIVEKTICFFLFPFCSAGGTRIEYCREDCFHLFAGKCGDDLLKLVGAGKVITKEKLYKFDDCNDLKSAADTSQGNETCRQIPFIELTPTREKTEMLDTAVIVVISVGIPVLILVVILCGLHRRRLARKERLHSIHYENGKDDIKNARLSNVVSMRDRIREWKVAPSEMVELMDVCKSRGVMEIAVDNIEYLKDLGAGQYGLVFQGKVIGGIEGETSPIVAVKTLREGSSQDAIKEFCQEVNIMSTFSHPNVVKLIGVSLAGEPYCMIFEFVEFGDLASFLRNCYDEAEEKDSAYPKLSVTDQMAMAVQIASGMKYISSIRCVHRDLAARNCLVGRGLVVKISDFGLSRDVYTSEYYRMDKTRMLPVRWLPPEAFVDGKFTTYSDVYSYGVVLWEIFTFAMLPYEDHDNTKTMELILEGNLLAKPDGCPAPVYDIMLKCWRANPEDRLPFSEIINELCSLDDFGQRFEADECDIHENYKARSLSQDAHVPLARTDESCNLKDEQPINIERLPAQPVTANSPHYAIPPSKAQPGYDGVVTSPEATTGQPPHGRNTGKVEAPRAVHPTTPPPDNVGANVDFEVPGSPRLYDDVTNDLDDPQETYDVPPKHENSEDEETYSLPPVPRKQRQETYDVPPTSHDNQEYPDGQEETYDVPPPRDEPQETYDVPPASIKQPLIEDNDRDNDVPQDTYDVPPKQLEDTEDDIYQNSLQVTPKSTHYSVPQSPFLKRRNENNTETNNVSSPSRTIRHSYENVDFDGKPLITS